MKHTENFHLPQWELADQVRMEDFNRMCGDLESGLVRGEEGIFRLAYNRFHLLRSMETLPRQMGYFFQSFAQNKGASVTGMEQRTDRRWMGNGGGVPALDQIRETLEVLSPMVNNTSYLHVKFVMPRCGRLKSVKLEGSYRKETSSKTKYYPCTVWLTNLSVGAREHQGSATLVLAEYDSMQSGEFEVININLPLHGGQQYRLEIKMDSTEVKETLYLKPDSTFFTLEGVQMSTGKAEASFSEMEASRGGIALVRYVPWGEGAEMTLNWNGETLSPYTVRPWDTGTGLPMAEAEFRKRTQTAAENKLRLGMRCPLGAELEIYDWGAMLI